MSNLDDFITPKQAFGKIPDAADMSGYNSPITMIAGQVETKIEADTMSVIQRYGIDVNKEELIKTLAYDREQYAKGYQDGYRKGYQDAKEDLIKYINELNSN